MNSDQTNVSVQSQGDVLIHPRATIDPSAVIGPNVSISGDVRIGRGVRIAESLVLGKASVGDHSLVKNCIVGWNSDIGSWSRVSSRALEISGRRRNPREWNEAMKKKYQRRNIEIKWMFRLSYRLKELRATRTRIKLSRRWRIRPYSMGMDDWIHLSLFWGVTSQCHRKRFS